MPPPSGQDSLEVRHAYLRTRHIRQLHDPRLAAGWVVFGAIVMWSLIAGVVLVAAR
jgi:hypothetical protein